MIAATVAAVAMAVVVQDQAALRAAPRDSAPQQAVLWQGDLVEVRGERIDHLQVWDHRRERAGFVKASQLRALGLQESDAPQLLSVLRFLRDTPGAEALGMAYVAAYLKAAPAARIDAEPFDALGTMAERLARRASSQKAGDTVSAHLEVAAQYGVKFRSFEREGRLQLCYDGEAFRRVLSMPASPQAQARAVLALTRHDCIDPALLPLARQDLDRQRAALLDRLPPAQLAELAEPLKQRLRVRRAGVWATLAFQRARAGEATAAAAQRAIDELAAVHKAELGDDDLVEYNDAALRVGASRWGALPALPPAGRLALRSEPGEPGQTCLLLGDAQAPGARAGGAPAPLLRRCTFGTLWLSSARVHPDGRSAVVSVQPLEGWTELWVLRARAEGWTVEVLPPAASEPGLGYLEFAGWVPGGQKLLVAREARVDGRLRRSFEVLSLETLNSEKQASAPQQLALFGQWQDPRWKQQTVSLR